MVWFRPAGNGGRPLTAARIPRGCSPAVDYAKRKGRAATLGDLRPRRPHTRSRRAKVKPLPSGRFTSNRSRSKARSARRASASPAGTVDVTVTTPGGTSATGTAAVHLRGIAGGRHAGRQVFASPTTGYEHRDAGLLLAPYLRLTFQPLDTGWLYRERRLGTDFRFEISGSMIPGRSVSTIAPVSPRRTSGSMASGSGSADASENDHWGAWRINRQVVGRDRIAMGWEASALRRLARRVTR